MSTQVLDILEDWLQGRHWGYQRIDGSVGALPAHPQSCIRPNLHCWRSLDCSLCDFRLLPRIVLYMTNSLMMATLACDMPLLHSM